MSHREEAERLLSHFVTSHPREAAQVHALLAIAEALRAPVTEFPRMCPTCQAIAEVSHGGNCNRCGVPNLSPWVLRVWTATDDEPVRRTDVYLCSAHVPSDLPVEQSVVMRRTDSAMAIRYGRVIRPLLKFDGADACVITDFYLARKP